jgi:hypothetical protein
MRSLKKYDPLYNDYYSFGSRELRAKRTDNLIRPSLKRWNFEKLLEAVRAKILAQSVPDCGFWITVEKYASDLRAKKHLVDRCFAVLNREGLLSQARNEPLHDSARHNFFPGSWKGWVASSYRIIK